MTWKNHKLKSTTKTKKSKITKNNYKHNIANQDLSYIEDDIITRKVEKFVNKNREKTFKKIEEKRSKRPSIKYQDADLEIMLSRINIQNKQKETSKFRRLFVYLFCIFFILVVLFFWIKFLFLSDIIGIKQYFS